MPEPSSCSAAERGASAFCPETCDFLSQQWNQAGQLRHRVFWTPKASSTQQGSPQQAMEAAGMSPHTTLALGSRLTFFCGRHSMEERQGPLAAGWGFGVAAFLPGQV